MANGLESQQGAGGAGSSGGDGEAARDHIVLTKRLHRFARARGAHRALTVSAVSPSGWLAETSVALRQDLGRLASLRGSAEEIRAAVEDAIPEIDRTLDLFCEGLRSVTDSLSLAQLRSAMQQIVDSHRSEVLGVLDLLIEDRTGLLERMPKIEYLVTLLSTEKDDAGLRRIVLDPVDLTPQLRRLGKELDAEDQLDAANVALELFQAAGVAVDEFETPDVLEQTRRRKVELGVSCLRPEILRALVTYNTRLYNVIAAQIESSRSSDAEFDDLLALHPEEPETAADPHSQEAESPDSNLPEASSESIFDSQGMARVCSAVRRRLENAPLDGSELERLALALDLTGLKRFERDALVADGDEPVDRLVALTVLVGLLNRELGAFREAIAGLGISEAQICGSWVEQLDQKLQGTIARGLGDASALEKSLSLTDVRMRHLGVPLALLGQAKGKESGTAEPPVRRQPVSSELSKPTRKSTSKPSTRPTEDGSPDLREASGRVGRSARPLRMVAMAASMVVIALALANVIIAPPATVSELETQQLGDASPYLVSAYRSDRGQGKLLVGRIHPSWTALNHDERRAVALDMVQRLMANGVQKIMVYDDRRALVVDYANGQLRVPGAAAQSP